jgi:HSP20 family protein
MSQLVTRGSAPAGNWGSLFGFDPFRNAFPNWSQMSGLEIQRGENGYTVEIPVAGFKPEEVGVTLEDGVITIAGTSERRKFTRSLLVPEEIDGDRVEARVEHGLLTLTLPLHPKAQPKKIEVKFANGAN